MEHGLKAVYMGMAALLFGIAILILMKYDSQMVKMNQRLNENQRSAEVIWIG